MNKLKIFLAVFLPAPAFLILADNPARAALNAYLTLTDGQGSLFFPVKDKNGGTIIIKL